MKPSVRRVADALLADGIEPDVVELAESTRTAQEAASAIGTSVPCIVKSLVFLADDEPILALVSGSNRADTSLLASALGKSIGRADAARVRDATGFAIGGIPPLGHPRQIGTWLDQDLLQYETVWAAAGTPNAVFEVDPEALRVAVSAHVLKVT